MRGSVSMYVLGAVLSAAAPAASWGQAQHPSRPMRMLVGFVPGGGTDVDARLLAPRLAEAWDQQVVVDNRPGTTGMIAATLIANATPDGYTILMGHASTNTVAPNLFAKLPYDPVKASVPVTVAGSVPHRISAHPSVPTHSLKELLAHVRAIQVAVNRAQNLPDVKERMDTLGTDGARTATPEEFAAMFRAELARYAQVIMAAGIRIE